MTDKLPKMSEKGMADLALDCYRGKVYLHDTEEKIRLGAMPLTMGGLEGWTEDDLNDIGMIISREEDWAPRSCNGIPMAFKVTLVSKSDWGKVVEKWKAIIAAVKNAQEGIMAEG